MVEFGVVALIQKYHYWSWKNKILRVYVRPEWKTYSHEKILLLGLRVETRTKEYTGVHEKKQRERRNSQKESEFHKD